MQILIPSTSLVLLIGPAGSGKTTFARKHFRSTEILSSDFCRALVCDEEGNQNATPAAFEVLHFIAERRLQARRLTVIDATNVQPQARKPLLKLAHRNRIPAVAIVFELPEEISQQWNRLRMDRMVSPEVITEQSGELRISLQKIDQEGYHFVYVLRSPEQINSARVELRSFPNEF